MNKKWKVALAAIAVLLLTGFYIATRYKEYIRGLLEYESDQAIQDHFKSEEAAKAYQKELQQQLKELGSADAEETLKKWKSQFGGK